MAAVQPLDSEAILRRLEASPAGAALAAFARREGLVFAKAAGPGREPEIEGRQVTLCCAHGEDRAEGALLGLAARGLRRAWLDSRGHRAEPRMTDPEHLIIQARLIAADSHAWQARIAAELAARGDGAMVGALPAQIRRGWQAGTDMASAMRGAFEGWFLDHHRRQRADRPILDGWRARISPRLTALREQLDAAPEARRRQIAVAEGASFLTHPRRAPEGRDLAPLGADPTQPDAASYLAPVFAGSRERVLGQIHRLMHRGEADWAVGELAGPMGETAELRHRLGATRPPERAALPSRAPAARRPGWLRRALNWLSPGAGDSGTRAPVAPAAPAEARWYRHTAARLRARGAEPDRVIARMLADCPAPELETWNAERVRRSTNCYAYAANDPAGHPANNKPQPGQKNGLRHDRISAAQIARNAEIDGMIPLGDRPELREGHYLVALVVAPGRDYHWYRLGPDGLWSHKPGTGAARTTDHAGKPICCPEICDRDDYREFVGYFLVPRQGLTVGPRARYTPDASPAMYRAEFHKLTPEPPSPEPPSPDSAGRSGAGATGPAPRGPASCPARQELSPTV